MQRFVLVLAMMASSSALAMDPASQFLQTTLDKGIQILSSKGTTRNAQFCSLVKGAIDTKSVGDAWLGPYANMASDQSGVTEFMQLVPSVLVTKLNSMLGGTTSVNSSDITISPNATDMGGGVYNVDVSIQTSQGTYDGTAVVRGTGSEYLLTDVQYMGFSGVSYLGQNFQNDLQTASNSNPNDPVSTEVKNLKSQTGFIRCP